MKLTKGSSIIKIKGTDGKITKATNFSWVEISDMHTCDAWAIEPMKLADIKGDVQAAADVLHNRRYVKKQKASEQEANQLVKKA